MFSKESNCIMNVNQESLNSQKTLWRHLKHTILSNSSQFLKNYFESNFKHHSGNWGTNYSPQKGHPLLYPQALLKCWNFSNPLFRSHPQNFLLLEYPTLKYQNFQSKTFEAFMSLEGVLRNSCTTPALKTKEKHTRKSSILAKLKASGLKIY